ncbi:MAG TPA: DUF3604 domain-containing protein [bacterium]
MKRIHLELSLLFAVILLILSARQNQTQKVQKIYPPSQDKKYWFETATDLVFSEEFHLPDYDLTDYGKIEYPSLAIDNKRTVYVAYDVTSDNDEEAIYLNWFDANDIRTEELSEGQPPRHFLKLIDRPQWHGAVQVSTQAGTEYRPRVAVTSNDDVWVVWSARRDGKWEIFARMLANGKLGDEQQITSNEGYDFRPVVLAERSGRVWVAWERGTADKHMHIVAKYFQAGAWSDEIVVEDRAGYAYRPVILETPDGTVWFGWDHTAGANTDIHIRSFKNGQLQPAIRVSAHPAIDNKPALAWHDGKLWVAWTTNRRGEDGWGIIRYPMVRACDGKNWYEPVADLKGIDLTSRSETQNYEFPTITFDPFGRLYLFTRHDHVFTGSFYDEGRWSDPFLLDEHGWGIRGFYVHLAWASDTELWMARRDRKTIFLQKMARQQPQKKSVRLKRYVPATYPNELNYNAATSFRGPTKHGDYRVYYGDLHVHTAYSDGAGGFDELYNLYQNIYRVDFLAITEHDAMRGGNNHFSPGEWAYLKALNEIYNQPGEFVTLNAYEWTHSTWSGPQDSSSRIGHKNVYFRSGEESPFFNHQGKVARDAASLFQTLHNCDAIAFPHHPPWGGITWEDHDPEVQTNYEIVSIHGANEYMGNLPIPHRGGMPGTFVQDGLAKGKVFGLVGASDSHGLFYHATEGWREDPYKGGLTGVLLDGPLNRENVWEALKARRNYATSGEKYFLEFFINDHPMGSVITVASPPSISFEARSTEVVYVYVIRNNEELFVSGRVGGERAFYRGLTDETLAVGRNVYYLRVVYSNGRLAWSSPIWVNYEPGNAHN